MIHQDLYNKLYQQNSNDQAEMLLNEVASFPYFSIPHFFLLASTKKNIPDYPTIAARTALHFNDAYFLDHQIRQFKNSTTVSNNDDPKFENKIATTEIEKEELLFEPLFASDYFASQGIKLSAEIKSDDKLGKQLKSFTEWLKTMKKADAGKLPETSGITDRAVSDMAEKSNTTAQIVTESMADVYIQQGKPNKAIEIYEQLSLHNPSKSVFFADKIKSLK